MSKTWWANSCIIGVLFFITLTSSVWAADPNTTVATPAFNPNGGTYNTEQTVTITCATPGAMIRYTLDDSDPNTGAIYDPDFPVVVDHTLTLKAKAYKDGCTQSSVKSAAYNLIVATPVFTPDGGVYDTDQTVVITCATTEAEIHYTTNSLDPNESDPIIENGGSLSVSVNPPTGLKVRAFKDSLTPSNIKTAIYKDSTIKYGGGAGEPNDPYQIWMPEDLNTLGANSGDWRKCFILMADIDMSVSDPNAGSQCIGEFTGTFDGNGHKISNLNITGNDYNVGLFGYIDNATIKNLGIENVNISAAYFGPYIYAGGLAGYMSSGTITNCSITGLVNSSVYYYYEYDPFSYAGGLVGYQGSGTISDCNSTATVSSSSFNYGFSSSCAGGLVGYQGSGTITNCCSSGSVTSHAVGAGDEIATGASSYGGGLVGESSGTIMNCYSTGSVTPSAQAISTDCYAGGLVGKQNSGVIENSCSMGPILIPDASYSHAGGLVGEQVSGVIENSYSMGSILIPDASYSYVGGLVGIQTGSSTRIEKCYSTGSISVTGYEVYKGGLLGYRVGISGAVNCFWDTQTSGLITSTGGNGRTTAQMKQASNYFGWNTPTETVWTIDEGVDYPRLAWQNLPGTPLSVQTFSDFIPGAGTMSNPYQISTPQQLNVIGLFPDQWNKVFYLENDIDFTSTESNLFSVIGVSNSQPFSGTFDGNGHVIRNLTYTGGDNYAGLFGYIDNATIKDLSVENVNLSTVGEYIGGLVGYQNAGTITNCCSSGIVNSSVYGMYSDTYNGGLVGYQNTGTISNCFSTVSVVSSGYGSFSFSEAGGLVGHQYLGTITNCYSMGSITSIAYGSEAGGLVGHISSGSITSCFSTGSVNSSGSGSDAGGLVGCQYNRGTITNCYSTGSVNSSASSWDSCSGGLVGYQYQGTSSSAKIEKCYSTGHVSATGRNVYKGGLVGDRSGIVTACFWDTQTSGLTTSAAGTGKTTAEMKTLLTFTSAGWDFETIWDICETTSYPRLQWQIPETDWVCPDGVNLEDLNYFVGKWLENDCASSNNYCDGVDIDTSGKVDLEDFAALAESWLCVDSSGNSIFYMWVPGQTGNALSFDGVNNHVEIPGYKGIIGTASRTCCAWVKTTGTKQGNILSWGADLAGQKWTFRAESNGTLGVGAWDGYVNTTATVNNGQWHHVAAVLNDDGSPDISEILLYIDGIPQNTTFSNARSIETIASQDVMIGAYQNAGSPTGYFKGLLDDVRIYNRALDAGEIVPLSLPETGLLTRWAMDEAAGYIAHDSVSSYDGTLTGF